MPSYLEALLAIMLRAITSGANVKLCRADKVLIGGCAAVAGSTAVLGPSAVSFGVPAAMLVAVLADGVFRPSSSTLYPTIAHGPRDRPQVALTFDDGPDPEVSAQVLDVLAEHRRQATFFMIGRHLERCRDIAERAVREGHEIGNHSWDHGYFSHASQVAAQLAGMERSEALIRSITGLSGRSPYRPAVGLKSPRFARAAHQLGLNVVAWSVHSRDTMDKNSVRIANRVLRNIRPGDIVLMHDGHQNRGAHRPQCPAALPLILEGLEQRGLEAVTVSTLLRTSAEIEPTGSASPAATPAEQRIR